MKKKLLSVLFIVSLQLAMAAEIITGKVVKVTDGDTITILAKGNQQVKIRLEGVDCPEKKQDFGTKAKQFTSDLCFGKNVVASISKKDQYGRSIAKVKLPNGRILNEELLIAGLAWHYKQYSKSTIYGQLELQARAKRAGIWSMKNQQAPWEFRKSKRTRSRSHSL